MKAAPLFFTMLRSAFINWRARQWCRHSNAKPFAMLVNPYLNETVEFCQCPLCLSEFKRARACTIDEIKFFAIGRLQ